MSSRTPAGMFGIGLISGEEDPASRSSLPYAGDDFATRLYTGFVHEKEQTKCVGKKEDSAEGIVRKRT